MDQPDQPFLLTDLWLIHDVRSAKLDQLFHIVLDQLSRSAQLSRLNIPHSFTLCCTTKNGKMLQFQEWKTVSSVNLYHMVCNLKLRLILAELETVVMSGSRISRQPGKTVRPVWPVRCFYGLWKRPWVYV